MKNNLKIRKVLLFSLSAIILSLLVQAALIGYLSTDTKLRVAEQQGTVAAMLALKDARFHTVQIQQFLTDVAATAEPGGFADAETHLKLVRESLDRFGRQQPSWAAFAGESANDVTRLHEVGVKMAHAYAEQGREAGNAIMKMPGSGFDDTSARLEESFDAMGARMQSRLDAINAALDGAARNAQLWGIGLAVACVLLVGAIMWVFDHSIVAPVGALRTTVLQIARDSNLTLRIPESRGSGISDVTAAFNGMFDDFHAIVERASSSAMQLAAAAEELSAVSSQTTSGIQEQHSQIDQAATAMNEMSATVQEVARNAEQAAHAAKEADQGAKSGALVATEAMGGIDALVNEVEKSANVISVLQTESESIGMVLDVIKGIAEQTNLLALNAAIEAARAGEQGRGFAVVADEVRTLASRTQKSTQEIHEMIARLQQGAANAVKVMEQARAQGKKGVEQVEKAAESLAMIAGAVATINDMNTQIASAAEEQSAVAEEINRNVVNISQVAIQSAEGSQHTAAASHELARLSSDLQGLVAQFKV